MSRIPASILALRRRVLGRLWPGSKQLGFDPSDSVASNKAAERRFEVRQKEHPLGTVGRSRLILRIIENAFPTERLSSEYFRNMDVLLQTKPKRAAPGKVMLGIGSGRSGSTSLAALLGTVDGSCCTHENPPIIDWTPNQAQIQFHIRRFRILADYFSLVADVSHWWLNTLDVFFEHFPESRVVGLFRDVDACTRSFMNVKGSGRGTLNHWAPHGNGIWSATAWDRAYPTYPVPDYAEKEPDRAKYEMIARYVQDYNSQLEQRAARYPERLVLAPSESLSEPAIQQMILGLAGAPGKPSKLRLNMRNVADGEAEEFIF